MAENSKIEWTTHTFNPVRGCVKVSEGCEHCYAETMSGRNPNLLGIWGRYGTRIVASADMWKKPLKWNKEAGKSRVFRGQVWKSYGEGSTIGEPDSLRILASYKEDVHEFTPAEWEGLPRHRPRVFCASLADVFEDWPGMMHFYCEDERTKMPAIGCAYFVPKLGVVPAGKTSVGYNPHERRATFQDVRDQTFRLIEQTPHLDWLLLTKRPENVMRMVPEAWHKGFPDNVWMGTTVENQKRADERIPLLLKIPAKVRFLSCEPLLGPVNVSEIRDAEGFEYMPLVGATKPEPRIHWVICGGESGGPKSRPMHPDWARSLRDQCAAAQVPFFMKQWGDWQHTPGGYPKTDVEWTVERVGKAKAGRLLDGVEHNGFPKLEGRDQR